MSEFLIDDMNACIDCSPVPWMGLFVDSLLSTERSHSLQERLNIGQADSFGISTEGSEPELYSMVKSVSFSNKHPEELSPTRKDFSKRGRNLSLAEAMNTDGSDHRLDLLPQLRDVIPHRLLELFLLPLHDP